MTFRAAKPRSEKCLHQFPSECVTNYKAAEANHVHVVVLDALVRGKSFMNQAGPNPRHFIRADRRTDSAAADSYAALHLPASNSPGQRHNKIRIIIAQLRLSVAEIDHCMTGLA